MSLKNNYCTTVTIAMSLLSFLLCIIMLSMSNATAELQQKALQITSTPNFKNFVTHMIKEQSSKIQTLLRKIQTNAQSVLEKIENIKQESKNNKRKSNLKSYIEKDSHQIESPMLKNNEIVDTALEAVSESRNFHNYATSGYGVSGMLNHGTPHSYGASHNYGASTYHHHSIGFDPINIVVSMSLLSFLLQALQGLLGRTRLPTPVVEARELQPVQDWTKKMEANLSENDKDKYYLKKKLFKKHFPN